MIWEDRYQKNNESFDGQLDRVARFLGDTPEERRKFFNVMHEGHFFPAGRTMSNAGIGDTLTLNNCFGGKTKFLTDKGYRRFMDCLDGEQVMVKDKNGVFRPATVRHFGKQPRVKIKLRTNRMKYEVIATPNHRWILHDGTETTNLKVGDRLYLLSDSTQYTVETKEDAEAFALGFVIGDGCDVKQSGYEYVKVRLCGEKRKYADILKQAGFRIHSMSTSDDLIATQNNAAKQDFLNCCGWRFLPLRMKQMVFYGYYAADGATQMNSVSTADERIAQFIEEVAPLAGYYITSKRDRIRDTPYKKGAKLITFFYTRSQRLNNGWRVEAIERVESGNVYCVEEPVTHTFMLEKGIVTGNCFVLGSVPDSMDGIFDMVHLGAITQKAGGGTGYDFSSLRPNGSPTHNDAVASGPVSFMEVFNAGTGTVLQGSRRGANMGVMSCYHPDIEEFIDCKADPDNPNKMQFFNLSVMVDDAFMNAVRNNDEIDLHFPVYREDFSIETDPDKWTHRKTIPARDLWNKIIRRAYENGEPGVLFYDTMNNNNNTRYCETIMGTNPCGEFLSGTLHIPSHPEASNYKGACNLGSLFLPSFLTLNTEVGDLWYTVHWGKLAETVDTAVRMLNKVIDKNHYPHEDYENYQKNMRVIGLGITGLADMMALLGIQYGSDESLIFVDCLMRFINYYALRTSCDMAKELGAFPYCNNREISKSRFIRKCRLRNSRIDSMDDYNEKNHSLQEKLSSIPAAAIPETIDYTSEQWVQLYADIEAYGLRNARLFSIAPTGTLSLTYGNNCSSGLEPIFMLEQKRKVKIGGQDAECEQVVNLKNPAWEIYQQIKGNKWRYITDDTFVTALELPVDKHLDVLAAIAYHVDMSCSKTINVPTDYSFKDTKKVYMKAWEYGLKGCTIFRPNEIRQGILLSADDNASESDSKAPVSDSTALPRGYVIQVDNDVIGRERHLRTGCGTLHAQAYFDPSDGELLETYASRGSMGGCNSFMIGMSRLISLAARAGVSVEDITDQLLSVPPCIAYNNRSRDYKDTSKGTSCPSAMGNALRDMYAQIQSDLGNGRDSAATDDAEDELLIDKIIAATKDIDAELLSQNKCPDCGDTLTFEGGCNVCKSCGWSKCG